ncbi:cytochrome P450 3A8-like [Amblyraja radiata]|uniref:cytochrome P450 3A8-like n=1 Tax=Amblyraja radiata TaxID=386614 RepID=UPI0014028AEC|nr:cytochrome P450 3A8-like [Amblyraja radiata]
MSTLLWESFGAIRAALPGQTCILLLTCLALLGWYSVAPFRFFKRLGIPGPMPLPFIGTFFHYRKGLFNFDVECYKKYGNIWGIFDGRKPVLCIMEPDLIKTILIKEFYTVFTNRRDFGLNGPFEESVLLVQDERWKRIRSVLSPVFTTGRLKEMCPIIKRYTQNLVKHAESKSKLNGVDMKDVFGSYSMDVVTSTSFSVDIDTINNPKDPFVTNVKKLVDFSFFDPVILLVILFPFVIPILEKLNYSFMPREVNAFFMAVVSQMKAKRQKGVHTDRVDFLQMMVDSQVTGTISEQKNDGENSTYKALTDTEILAQGFTFIFAGYETTSNTLSYVAYSLAVHPDVQKKLQQEIDEAFPNKAPPTYDGVMYLEYLEMVICETLRLYPPAPRLERICKKDVKLNGVTIPKDTVVVIPAYALHRDPKYWPEPEEFRPERFSKEARETLNPAVYLPFGMGPRNCIGMRFAQLMMKMALVSLLQNLTLVPCAETPIPLELNVKGPMHPKKPIILKFVPREDVDSQE